MTETEEIFSISQIIFSIQDFLEYGEKMFAFGHHKGAFAGIGFPARALRYHLKCLRSIEEKKKDSIFKVASDDD